MSTLVNRLMMAAVASYGLTCHTASAFVAPQKSFDNDYMLIEAQVSGPGGGLKLSMGDNDLPSALGGGAKGNWPDANGIGLSTVVFRINECGAVAPHVHSDATEIQTVIMGEAIIGTYGVNGNALTLENVTVGDTFFFPRGSMHFQINSGPGPFVSVGAFDASHPTAAVVSRFVAELGDAGKALGLEYYKNNSTDGVDGLFPQFEMSKCGEVLDEFMSMM